MPARQPASQRDGRCLERELARWRGSARMPQLDGGCVTVKMGEDPCDDRRFGLSP